MSSITWSGDRLIQRVGKNEEELGKVTWDGGSEMFVLWLKDTCGVLGVDGGYMRGDEFASMADAKEKAAFTVSASIMHWIWIRKSVKDQVSSELEVDWKTISSEIDGDVKRSAVRGMVAKYLDTLPVGDLRKWGKRIAEGTVVGLLIDLIKKLPGL